MACIDTHLILERIRRPQWSCPLNASHATSKTNYFFLLVKMRIRILFISAYVERVTYIFFFSFSEPINGTRLRSARCCYAAWVNLALKICNSNAGTRLMIAFCHPTLVAPPASALSWWPAPLITFYSVNHITLSPQFCFHSFFVLFVPLLVLILQSPILLAKPKELCIG